VTTNEASNTAGLEDSLREFPLPGTAASVVAVPALGHGPGYWAGASSAALDEDGTFVIGYRVRNGHDGIAETVIARSEDGERFTTVATLEQSEFGAKSMERPSLVRTETGAGVCMSAAPTLAAPTGGSTHSKPTSKIGERAGPPSVRRHHENA
jgi:hypothetical protein